MDTGRRTTTTAALLGLGLGLASCVAAGAPPMRDPVATAPVVTMDETAETVVLLHGLGRTQRSMGALERALAAAGYEVVNLGYPSRHHTVRDLADTLAAELDACCSNPTAPLHFVTHSLGGILVRAYSEAHGPDRIGRVVMLSPPNQGSEVVDRLPERLLSLLVGPAGLQLGTDSTSLAHNLPAVDFELGIIAGDASINPLFSWWLPGEDDGTVTVASTRVEGAEDFLVVPYSHTWIMTRAPVIEQVLSFLETGRFRDPPAGSER